MYISRAGPKIGQSWETVTKRTERKEKNLSVRGEEKKKKMIMIGKFFSAGTILEFLLLSTLQVVGNTIWFLSHEIHSCQEEVNAVWKY